MSNGSGASAQVVASAATALTAAILAHGLMATRTAMNEQAAIDIYRSVFKALKESPG